MDFESKVQMKKKNTRINDSYRMLKFLISTKHFPLLFNTVSQVLRIMICVRRLSWRSHSQCEFHINWKYALLKATLPFKSTDNLLITNSNFQINAECKMEYFFMMLSFFTHFTCYFNLQCWLNAKWKIEKSNDHFDVVKLFFKYLFQVQNRWTTKFVRDVLRGIVNLTRLFWKRKRK